MAVTCVVFAMVAFILIFILSTIIAILSHIVVFIMLGIKLIKTAVLVIVSKVGIFITVIIKRWTFALIEPMMCLTIVIVGIVVRF